MQQKTNTRNGPRYGEQNLGSGFTNVKRINIAVSYAQNRKSSVITIEADPSPTIKNPASDVRAVFSWGGGIL
jgi:hypothetical protein